MCLTKKSIDFERSRTLLKTSWEETTPSQLALVGLFLLTWALAFGHQLALGGILRNCGVEKQHCIAVRMLLRATVCTLLIGSPFCECVGEECLLHFCFMDGMNS